MQKISGILPSNSRITTVDRRGEQTLRSGHEARFGQKMGASEVVRPASPKLTVNEAPSEFARLSDRKKKDRMHAEIVKRMSDQFFAKPQPKPEPVVVSPTGPFIEPSSQQKALYAEPRSYAETHVKTEDYGPFTVAVNSAKEENYGAFTINPSSNGESESTDSNFHAVGTNLSVVA